MMANPECRRIGGITRIKHANQAVDVKDAEMSNLRDPKPKEGLGQIAGCACQTGGQDDRDDLDPRDRNRLTHGPEDGHEYYHWSLIMVGDGGSSRAFMIMTAHWASGTPPPPPPLLSPPTRRRTEGRRRVHAEETART